MAGNTALGVQVFRRSYAPKLCTHLAPLELPRCQLLLTATQVEAKSPNGKVAVGDLDRRKRVGV